MSDKKPMENTTASPQGPDTDGRKPYQRPRILSRESLEAMANVCSFPGAKGPSDGGCTVSNS